MRPLHKNLQFPIVEEIIPPQFSPARLDADARNHLALNVIYPHYNG